MVRGLVRHPCAATTASVLDALGVPPSALRSIYYDPRVSGGERGYLQGYDAWVRLADQPGNLVIRHDVGCRFITSYTSGTVRLGTALRRSRRPFPYRAERRVLFVSTASDLRSEAGSECLSRRVEVFVEKKSKYLTN